MSDADSFKDAASPTSRMPFNIGISRVHMKESVYINASVDIYVLRHSRRPARDPQLSSDLCCRYLRTFPKRSRSDRLGYQEQVKPHDLKQG